MGKRSTYLGDPEAFRYAYNIEVQGNPWEPLTDEQITTLQAFWTLKRSEGVHDSLAFSHMLVASENLPGGGYRSTGRKPDGVNVLKAIGLPVRIADSERVDLDPIHEKVLELESRGLLDQDSFNEAFQYLGRIAGNRSWRVSKGGSAYPVVAWEMRSPAALYFFPGSKTMKTGEQLYRSARNSYGTLMSLPEDAIVVFASRNRRERIASLPAIRAAVDSIAESLER
jgi:hypothetical protein